MTIDCIRLLGSNVGAFQRSKTHPSNECPVYSTKQSDDEAPVMLERWGMPSIPSLPSLPGPL